jgi:hypothetical protein
MRVWFKSIRVLVVATASFYISEPRHLLADALDVWQTNATLSASGTAYSIAYGNGEFVAVAGSSLAISPDGTQWTQYISPPVLSYEGVVFGGGVFMAFGYPVWTNSSGPRYIVESYDGIHWTNVYETPVQIANAAYGNNQFVFVGSHIIFTTLNPFQWTEFDLGFALTGVTYGAGHFVAVGYGAVLSSADGIVWQYDYAPAGFSLGNVAYGNGMFVATWATNTYTGYYSDYDSADGFLISSNLASWQCVTLGNSYGDPVAASPGIAFGGGDFIGAAYTNYGLGSDYTYTSTNGLNWVNRVGANGATRFAFGAGSFVADGNGTLGNGVLLQSGVFALPTNPPASNLTIAIYPGVTINGTVGATYQIQYTTNLNSTWLPLTNISLPYSPFLWVDTRSSVVGQRFYRSVQLQ